MDTPAPLLKRSQSTRRPSSRSMSISNLSAPMLRSDILSLTDELDVKIEETMTIKTADIDYIDFPFFRSYDLETMMKTPWIQDLLIGNRIQSLCDATVAPLADSLTMVHAEMGSTFRSIRKHLATANKSRLDGIIGLHDQIDILQDRILAVEKEKESVQQELRVVEDSIRQRYEKRFRAMEKQKQNEEANRLKAREVEKEYIEKLHESLQQTRAELMNQQTENAHLKSENSRLQAWCDEEAKNRKKLTQSLDSHNNLAVKLLHDLEVRNETVAKLMERESLRDAEIKKMASLTALNSPSQEKDQAAQYQSSVLCVMCQGQLNDLSSLEDAILNRGVHVSRLHCDGYKALLDANSHGNEGNNNNNSNSTDAVVVNKSNQAWVKKIMRKMLSDKLRQVSASADMNKFNRFYSFVFQWFNHTTIDNQDTARRDLYHGLRHFVNQGNAEAALFWTLLSDCFGNDGCYFVLHCVNVTNNVLAPNNPELNILESTNEHIQIRLAAAEIIVERVARGATETRLTEMKQCLHTMQIKDDTKKGDTKKGDTKQSSSSSSTTTTTSSSHEGYIDLFMMLRILLRYYEGEQIQRVAALQVMLDTIAQDLNANLLHGTVSISFKQFQAIFNVVFAKSVNNSNSESNSKNNSKVNDEESLLSDDEMIQLYQDCFFHRPKGNRMITAQEIVEASERKGYTLRQLHAFYTSPFDLDSFHDEQSQ